MEGVPVVDWVMKRGTPFTRTVTYKAGDPVPAAVNLTGCSAALKVWQNYNDVAPVFTLTSPSGGLVIDATAGTIAITISAVNKALITATSAFYGLRLTMSDGSLRDLFQGKITMQPQGP